MSRPPALEHDGLWVSLLAWSGAVMMLAERYYPQPYADLARPEIWPRLPVWLRALLPAPGQSLIDDPVNRLLATAAMGLGLVYLAAALAGPRRGTVWLRWAALAGLGIVLAGLPALLQAGLAQWDEPARHSHDGGVLQTEAALERVLAGRNPYAEDYLGTPQARQSEASAFWRQLGGNPALYHLPYLPLSFLLPIPARAAALAVLGWFDLRLVYLAALAAAAAAAASLARPGADRRSLTALVLLNPLLLPHLVWGRNDILMLALVMGAAALRVRRRFTGAMALLGCACATKQLAWIIAPLWIVDLAASGRRRPRSLAAPLAALAIGAGVFLVPFLAWDPAAFLEDTVAFMAGGGAHPYPLGGTPGLGLANWLAAYGRVPSLASPYPFGWLQIILAGPLLVWLALRQWRRPGPARLLAASALLAVAVSYLGRAFHSNYLAFPLALLAAGLWSREEAPAGRPLAAADPPLADSGAPRA